MTGLYFCTGGTAIEPVIGGGKKTADACRHCLQATTGGRQKRPAPQKHIPTPTVTPPD